MKTALAKKPTELETIVSIALAQVKESALNHRTDFGDLTELAETMRPPNGKIHQALVVRAVDDKKHPYEIVFGHRRFRAAKLAKLDVVPAVIRELTDAEVVEAQLIENLARKDVNAMEEAEGFEQLQKQGKSPDEIADAIGKSKAHVYGRLKLLALRPAGRKAMLAGEINASVALLLARIPNPERQDKAIKEVLSGGGYDPDLGRVGAMSVRAAFDHIQTKYMLRLAGAPFRQDDADVYPEAGSCKDCPKRTGNQKHLFDDVKSADVCTDPDCFSEKVKLNAAHQLKLAEEKGKDVIKAKNTFRKQYAEAGKPVRYSVKELGDFVDPKAEAPGGEGKTWEELLGRKLPEPKLAQDPSGKIHKLISKDEAIEGLRLAGKKAALKAVKRFDNSHAPVDYAEENRRHNERVEQERVLRELRASILHTALVKAATTQKQRLTLAVFALRSERASPAESTRIWAELAKETEETLSQWLFQLTTDTLLDAWQPAPREAAAKAMGVSIAEAEAEAKAMFDETLAAEKTAEAELQNRCATEGCENQRKGEGYLYCEGCDAKRGQPPAAAEPTPAPAKKGRKAKGEPAPVSATAQASFTEAEKEMEKANEPAGDVDGNGDFPGDAAGQ